MYYPYVIYDLLYLVVSMKMVDSSPQIDLEIEVWRHNDYGKTFQQDLTRAMGNSTDSICARIDNELLSKSLMFFFKRNHQNDINVTLYGRWLQCRALNCDEIPVVLLQEAAWSDNTCEKGRKPFCSVPVTCLLVNATQTSWDSQCTFTCICPSPGSCSSRFAFSLIPSANGNPDKASDLELCGLGLGGEYDNTDNHIKQNSFLASPTPSPPPPHNPTQQPEPIWPVWMSAECQLL